MRALDQTMHPKALPEHGHNVKEVEIEEWKEWHKLAARRCQ
jgi:hypothetical protein